MRLQFTLAWRYLNGHRLRTILTTLAVVFGVLVIFGMNIVLPTMIQAFQANVMAASGQVDLTITSRTGAAFPETVANELIGITGIRASSSVLDRTINLPKDFVDGDPSRPDRITAVNLTGVNPQSAQAMHVYLIQNSGRFLLPNDTNAAVISQSLADAYGTKLGGNIKIPSVNGIVDLKVVGILPPNDLPTNEQVLVTLSEAQAITNQTGQINLINVDLVSTDASERDRTVETIKSTLGSEYQTGTLQPGSELLASIQLGQAALNMFGVLALFMGGFIIFNTFRTVVTERRRDIGMLRALGAKRSTITGMILVEGLLQGLIGSGVGLILGYLFGAVIIRIIQSPLNSFINLKLNAPVVTLPLIAVSVALGVGITVLSGLIPARNASRITPMDALRPSVAEVEYKQTSRASFIAGAGLLGSGLLALASGNVQIITIGGILFLLGLILVSPYLLRPIVKGFGWLAARMFSLQGTSDLVHGNLTRQPARVTVTASATMIGLAIVVALGGMTTSLSGMMGNMLRKSLGSDYLFIPPSVSVWNSDMGASPDFASRLKAIPGVAEITTLRFASSLADGTPVSLMGIDPITFPQVSGLDFKQGNKSAYEALSSGRDMIVNGSFMAIIPVKVGDTFSLATPGGSQDYRVIAIASDLLNAKVVTAYISQANMAADFSRTEDVFLQLNLKPGANLSQLDAQIKTVAADYPQFSVIAGKTYIDQMLNLLKMIFSGMYLLLAFLALPSLIAMLNTLTISVLERRREIGMIRAVGGTRRQIHRMVVVEALLLAAFGTALGILCGMYLGYVIIRALNALLPVQYVFPLAGLAAGIAIGLIFGALAAIIPSRQAARLQVVEALRYE